MPSLEKTLRNQLERAVKEARDIAEAGAKAALETLGVGDAGAPSYLDDEQRNVRRRLRIHGRQLGDLPDEKQKTQEIGRLTEEVAYEHWHRMLFARFLAENNVLMYPDPQGPVAVSLVECEEMAVDEGARNGWELAARYAARMLPQIFRPDSPVFEFDLPPETQQSLEALIGNLPTEVFTASDSLGWVYQFWQANRKEQINKSEVKIGARELPAVTQLFTEDYMVDFLLDNTLGAWHAGKILAENRTLVATAQSEDELRNAVAVPGCPWAYLRFIKTVEGDWTPAAGIFDGWPKAAKDLKCLDPCMGSGHFVVAMLERLVALRMVGEKLNEAAAVVSVIRDNLFGLEIDPRCTQIAAFNLALAAWRRTGYCILPPMNLACSGLAPNTSRDEWLALAGDNEKLQNGMDRLFDLFEKAPVLGSLINPRAEKGSLVDASYHELQPLLERALSQESITDCCTTNKESFLEMAVTARGLANAADILASQFTLVTTNVPYLGRGKQNEVLMRYCEQSHPEAKSDIATCFIERCLKLCVACGVTAVVAPNNWLYLTSYGKMRTGLLNQVEWNVVAKVGPRAFETIGGEVVNVVLIAFSKLAPHSLHMLTGLDASEEKTVSDKAVILKHHPFTRVMQSDQIKHPDARIILVPASKVSLLQSVADTSHGQGSFDSPRFSMPFWVVSAIGNGWVPQQSSPAMTQLYGGCHFLFRWENGNGGLAKLMEAKLEQGYSSGKWKAGIQQWGKIGVLAGQMGAFPATLYLGHAFDENASVIIPHRPKELSALWEFCCSKSFRSSLKEIDQSIKITCSTLVKVPFDLSHWQKVAAEKYPDGLPKPFSSDPTQWLFNGHPHGSDNPLQVAVARLSGYQWPRQTGASFPDCPALGPDGLETLADKDGIVCIPPVRGEAGAADRLLNLLAAAYGSEWSTDVLSGLLSDAGYSGKSLEAWLRDGFFQQHCELFHQRPFIWHIWDGLRDGFAALVNYHKLDRKNLETLIYTYLGDWITRQSTAAASGVDGAQEKLAAAEQLKKRLELILAGEAPCDIFVRWKPLHQQPIGWDPDLNDGVRLNIRPFVSVPDVKAKGAGILRVKPKIKWEKDRGKEPNRPKDDYPWFWGWDEKTTDFPGGSEFKGERFNDCHYTLAAKSKAREAQL